MGLNLVLFIRNKREIKHGHYGSQYSYSIIYSYCIFHSSFYRLFTYNLRKNEKLK